MDREPVRVCSAKLPNYGTCLSIKTALDRRAKWEGIALIFYVKVVRAALLFL
jgi:hypothetical protein